MAGELVADCPRCDAKRMTFDVTAELHRSTRYGWQFHYEVFAVCRECHKSTIFALEQLAGDQAPDHGIVHNQGLLKLEGSINNYMRVKGFISIKDVAATRPPDHVPNEIKSVFEEGATCLATECWNAAATMFRLCIDLATRALLPPKGEVVPGLRYRTRRDLGLRLDWLFENGRIPPDLEELSHAVREDGNDAAHAGTLKKEDAEDLSDFAYALLDRLYTEPARIAEAKDRRNKRRAPQGEGA